MYFEKSCAANYLFLFFLGVNAAAKALVTVPAPKLPALFQTVTQSFLSLFLFAVYFAHAVDAMSRILVNVVDLSCLCF